MKTLVTYCLLAMLMACNTSEGKKEQQGNTHLNAQTTQAEEKNSKKNEKNLNLPQKGDYTALFRKQECTDLITAEELSKLKGTPVKQEAYGCNFTLGVDKESTNRITITHQIFPKERVEKEIKNYIKDAPFIYQELSASGDTYFCHQPAPGRLLIFNPNYANTIMINYSKRYGANSLDKQTIEENKEFAIKTANFLMDKHSK